MISRADFSATGPRAQRGFTLIELMLALALTALLLGMLSGGVYTVVRDWDNNASALDDTLDETIAILQLERALQGAFAHSYRDPSSLGRFVFFEGESNSLSWVSTVSPQRGSGLFAWRLTSSPREGVQLQLAPALTDYPGYRLDRAETIPLLPHYQAEFRFLYEETQFDRRWRDSWNGESEMLLPLAVHVLLTPIRGSGNGTDRRRPLDVLAALHANQHRSLRPAGQATFATTPQTIGPQR